MELTNEIVLSDIAGFKARISEAESKLAELLAGRLPYREHKKREAVRRDLESEINHVRNLIKLAESGLEMVTT